MSLNGVNYSPPLDLKMNIYESKPNVHCHHRSGLKVIDNNILMKLFKRNNVLNSLGIIYHAFTMVIENKLQYKIILTLCTLHKRKI